MIESTEAGITITGEHVALYQLLVMRSGIKLEMLGLRRRGGSITVLVKKRFGFTGNRAKVLLALEEKIARDFPLEKAAHDAALEKRGLSSGSHPATPERRLTERESEIQSSQAAAQRDRR